MARASTSDRLEVAVLRRLAKDGDWVAWDRLAGLRKLRPSEVRKRRAATLSAARAGDPQAQWEMAYLVSPGRSMYLHSPSRPGIPWARRAARAGLANAACALGKCASSRGARERWLRLAVRLGDDYAPYRLALHEVLPRGDIRAARRWLTRGLVLDAAAGDHAQALASLDLVGAPPGSPEHLLRRALLFGDARGREHDAVLRSVDRVAAIGTPLALWAAGAVGLCECPRSRQRIGERRLIEAARRGCAWAAYDLGGVWWRSDAWTLPWTRRAAEAGIAWAQEGLGEAHMTGNGVRRNAREEARWHRLAAEQGVPQAMLNLGVCLHEGRGVRRDDRAAVRWYRRAAALGEGHACSNLGLCYKHGHGVRKNPRRARYWFERAALLHQHAKAAAHLGDGWDDGLFGRRDPVEAARWYRRAAALGDTRALRALGRAYHNGHGVERDWPFSVLLYRYGSALGDAGSTFLLGVCYLAGDGVSREGRRARSLFRRAARMGDRDARLALRRFDLLARYAAERRGER